MSWLFRGPDLSRKAVFGPFSLLFRGFFVAPVLGKFYAYSPWNSLLTMYIALRKNTPKFTEIFGKEFGASGVVFRCIRAAIRAEVCCETWG